MKNLQFISINKVALALDVSVNTIKRWYLWFENDSYDHKGLMLPKYYYLDKRNIKMFYKEDLKVFRQFQKALNTTHKGAMSEFNAKYQWGNRGKDILERKEIKNNEQNED